MDGKEIDKTDIVLSEKLPNGITNIKIARKFKIPGKCAGSVASPGHVFYVCSYKRDGVDVRYTIQITLATEKSMGKAAVELYVKDKYVK